MTTTAVTTPAPTIDPEQEGSADPVGRPLPLWASIPIILFCLLAGGGIIYWYMGSHAKADEPRLLGDVPARPVLTPRPASGGGGRNWMSWMGGGSRGIRPTNGQRDGYDAYTEKARARYILNGNAKPNLSLSYGQDANAYAFIPEDVRGTLYATSRLLGDKRYTDALALPPAQLAQLRSRSSIYMKASEADRSLVLADFAAYRAAKPDQRAAAQTKLLADLDGVAERSQPGTKASLVDNAAKINAIVTPEQWTKLKAMGLKP